MKFKRIAILALILIISLSVSTGALAQGENISIINVNPNNIVLFGEVIGKLSVQDGVLLPDAPAVLRAGSLFSMTATKVSNLLTTYGVNGKSFTGSVIDGLAGEGLKITGTGMTSTGAGTIKVGACYYQASNDTFISICSYNFVSGVQGEMWRSKAYFNNSMTYYGHVTNNNGSGTVAGTFNFSVATKP
ncbi:MAG: hypothetical protein GX025_09605 [Clostridiales bacterium]|nr:hypothetical protein [Clostridiales bacterium]